jgi:hypothetical protein
MEIIVPIIFFSECSYVKTREKGFPRSMPRLMRKRTRAAKFTAINKCRQARRTTKHLFRKKIGKT